MALLKTYLRTVVVKNRVFCVVLLSATFAFSCQSAVEETPPAARAETGTAVVNSEGEALGAVSFPTSCDPAAQSDLELGLALLHHMNYAASRPAFQVASTADPDCAMAYWGQAMAYIHPLWPDTISSENRVAGEALLAQATAAKHTSQREAAFIAAVAGYYSGPDRTESDRLSSLLEGWKSVHAEYPDDTEAALFHALALLGNASLEDKTYSNQLAAGKIVEDVMSRVSSHPGAHHYTIHAYDSAALAERALPIARRYDDLAPENTHALHMTSHIFTRVGEWPESIEFNTRAAAASAERTAGGALSLHHFHALDYLAYAHLQRADEGAAQGVLEKLMALEPPFQNHAATAYSFAAVPARLALERHDWQRAATVEARWPAGVEWDQYPHLEAIPYFAAALGAARTGQPEAARKAIAQLARLEGKARAVDGPYDWGTQVAIQRIAAEAWLAFETADRDQGLALAAEAAEMEGATDKNPVTPGEVLPANELYGDMLLASTRYVEALEAYRLSLERSPNRFNSLYGAGRAAELAGNEEVARAHYSRLLEISSPTGERSELEHARAFVAKAEAA